MTQYKSSSDLKDLAKEKLSGKYGISMLVAPVLQGVLSIAIMFPALFVFFFGYIMFIVMTAINDTSTPENTLFGFIAIYLILVILCGFFIGVLNVGVAYFNLNLACGRTHKVSDLFYGFRYHFKRSLALSVMQTLPSFVLAIPYVFCCVVWLMNPDSFWILGVFLSAIVYIVLLVYIQLCWSQCYYLLLDFPQFKAIDLLKLSMRVMNGHKSRLLYIQFSFLPLEFLCMCSSSIGNLWYVPYANMTYTLFFLDIMQPTAQTQTTTTNDTHAESASELF